MLVQPRPQHRQPLQGMKILARSCTADGSVAIVAPPAAGVATAGASETAGAWETVTVSKPSCCSRLARRPLSSDHEQSEEGGNRPRDRERSRERRGRSRDHELPGERGNVHAVDATGSGQKTVTGHAKSGPGEIDINPRIGLILCVSLCVYPSRQRRSGSWPFSCWPCCLSPSPRGSVCFGSLAVFLSPERFHARVFRAWGLASDSSGSRTSREGVLACIQGASDSLRHPSPGGVRPRLLFLA